MKNVWLWLRAFAVWTKLTFHNSLGIVNVFNIVWIRPMKGGLLNAAHPMVTGIDPKTQKPIWPQNIIFASLRDDNITASDEEIILEVGNHMRGMVLRSSSQDEFPYGKPDRMPPAINYIHAAVHYNGGYLLFNSFKDAISHFTDKEFQKSFVHFVKTERREPVTVIRQKEYNRDEFLEFVCFLRTIFPWFSNSNGNKKRIGWGNPAPYPAINTITGYWKDGTYKIYSEKGRSIAARPPISKKYFHQAVYKGDRDYVIAPEIFLARFTDKRVIARKEKGNLFFVDLRKIKSGYLFDPSKPLPKLLERMVERLSDKIKSWIAA